MGHDFPAALMPRLAREIADHCSGGLKTAVTWTDEECALEIEPD